jgi:hypothetical protein
MPHPCKLTASPAPYLRLLAGLADYAMSRTVVSPSGSRRRLNGNLVVASCVYLHPHGRHNGPPPAPPRAVRKIERQGALVKRS